MQTYVKCNVRFSMGESVKVSEDASEPEIELDNDSDTESESVVMTVKGYVFL